MKTVEGEILKSKITNDLHIVKRIEGTRVTLENYSGSIWISLFEKDLGFYYEKMGGGDNS